MTEEERQELSIRLAVFEGPPGFDPRPAIEAMTIPGLWLLGETDASIPTPESKAISEDIIDKHGQDLAFPTYPDQGHDISPDVYLSDAVEWIDAQLEG